MGNSTACNADTCTLSGESDHQRPNGDDLLEAALFVVLQADAPSREAIKVSLDEVDHVEIGRGEVTCARRAYRWCRLELADRRVSPRHGELVREGRDWRYRDLGSQNGSVVPRPEGTLHDGDLIEAGRTFLLFRNQPTSLACTDEPFEMDPQLPELTTFNPSLAWSLRALSRIARSRIPVLIIGETGTGKEVVARALHAMSRRRGDFIAINCGALPPTLLEAELFGARKGSFSGATEDRPGLVRAAHEGTLLLDELGDLPLAAQPAFLRVLQQEEVIPIGSTRPIPVDLRVVAATHRDLDGLRAAAAFRDDLWARLAGYCVHLPPLRQRREDLGLLIPRLLRRHGLTTPELTFSNGAARQFLQYDWPGNVRELEQVLRSAVALAETGTVERAHLPGHMRPVTVTASVASHRPRRRPLDEAAALHREHLIQCLRRHHGNVAAVARELGKAPVQIYRWLKRYELSPEPYRYEA